MKLYAISDLHLERPKNREALNQLSSFLDDGLILAGDICSTATQLEEALIILKNKFKQIIWVPGNHELWLTDDTHKTSIQKYNELVSLCRKMNVATPEDEYIKWKHQKNNYLIVPMTLLYDYSFRPEHVEDKHVISWAKESGVLCRDEHLLNTGAYQNIKQWCWDRVEYTRQRLEKCDPDIPMILVNHFPLRYDLVRTMRIPRFSIWCGTRKTEHWHKEYNVDVVVSGHLHMRSTDYRDGVRFEEVSLGYPKDWRSEEGVGLSPYLREILPGPSKAYHHAGPFWKFRL
ncbi:MAG: metallophosphoesterase family protein [Cellvibrionaceae bacterium]